MDRKKVIREFENWCDAMEDECPVICHRVLDLLKEQEELLYKKQKDIDRLCNEISEWKHKFHDKSLKEHEARVLTIEEALVDNNNSIEISPYVFVEIKGRNDIFIGSVHDDIYGDYHSNDIKVRVYRIWMSDSKTYPKADYTKTVRFWNRKPTDEQRQAVKWE